jgi:single-strand DNA-binding protein
VASLNKIMLIGNAGKDAELRYTANGVAQAQFSLAVNFRRRGTSGEYEDNTEWFNIILFRETAERVSQYITKGKSVYVEGRLQTRSWDGDDGVKHYRTEVIANSIQLLGGRDGGGGGGTDWGDGGGSRPPANRGGYGGGQGGGQRRGSPGDEIDVDDLPFE